MGGQKEMPIEDLKKNKRQFWKKIKLNIQSNALNILCWFALSLSTYLGLLYIRS